MFLFVLFLCLANEHPFLRRVAGVIGFPFNVVRMAVPSPPAVQLHLRVDKISRFPYT